MNKKLNIEMPNRKKTITKEYQDALKEIDREPSEQLHFQIEASYCQKLHIYLAKKRLTGAKWLRQVIKSLPDE